MDHLLDRGRCLEKFKNTGPTAVAAVKTAFTALPLPETPARGVRIHHFKKPACLFARFRFCFTFRTNHTHQSLRDNQTHRRSDKVWLKAYIPKPAESAGCVVGMQGTKDKMTGKRGSNGNTCCLQVAYLSHHNDIRVLTQDRTQGVGKGEVYLGFNLYLVDFFDQVFNRVFHGLDI